MRIFSFERICKAWQHLLPGQRGGFHTRDSKLAWQWSGRPSLNVTRDCCEHPWQVSAKSANSTPGACREFLREPHHHPHPRAFFCELFGTPREYLCEFFRRPHQIFREFSRELFCELFRRPREFFREYFRRPREFFREYFRRPREFFANIFACHFPCIFPTSGLPRIFSQASGRLREKIRGLREKIRGEIRGPTQKNPRRNPRRNPRARAKQIRGGLFTPSKTCKTWAKHSANYSANFLLPCKLSRGRPTSEFFAIPIQAAFMPCPTGRGGRALWSRSRLGRQHEDWGVTSVCVCLRVGRMVCKSMEIEVSTASFHQKSALGVFLDGFEGKQLSILDAILGVGVRSHAPIVGEIRACCPNCP